jgi:predicted nucleotidyltransferase
MSRENELLKEVVRRIVKTLNVKIIILFGSRARGDWTPQSDYDLLIIADFKESYLDRIKLVLDIIGDIPLEVEPHPYTLEEAVDMLKRGNPTIVDALEEGKVLYASNDLNKLLNLFKELKRRGMKRSKTSIILPEDSK